jgi:hypothetical protein
LILVFFLAAGAVLFWGSQVLAAQKDFYPGTILSSNNTVTVAPLANYTLWTMTVSNSLTETWNINTTYSFTGNTTLLILDADGGVTYRHGGMDCIFNGVPPQPCGGTEGDYFAVTPGSNHDLEVLVHSNDTSPGVLNGTAVSYSYVTHPSADLAVNLEYAGGVFIVAGLIVFGWREEVLRRLITPPGQLPKSES